MELRHTTLPDGMTLGYRELGEGPPIVLLHGWPTSSLLWRDVMPALAAHHRVIALDLPGFGGSDKPVGASYDFAFHDAALDGFAARLGLDTFALAGHDLGGPVAVHHAMHRPGRVTALALLNTLLYPEFSESVEQFLTACRTPDLRDRLTSPQGLEAVMRFGVADQERLSAEAIAGVQAPFETDDARLALAQAGLGLELAGFEDIAARLPTFEQPLRVVYGAEDRVLPDMPESAARLQRDVPHAEVTALPGVGHFCQEEAGAQIGELLAAFFARQAVPA